MPIVSKVSNENEQEELPIESNTADLVKEIAELNEKVERLRGALLITQKALWVALDNY
jgi:hypothetical protein